MSSILGVFGLPVKKSLFKNLETKYIISIPNNFFPLNHSSNGAGLLTRPNWDENTWVWNTASAVQSSSVMVPGLVVNV